MHPTASEQGGPTWATPGHTDLPTTRLPTTDLPLTDLPAALRRTTGAQDAWWTVDSSFEILLGCVLVQNTNWRNVERSLSLLRAAGITSPARLLELNGAALVPLVAPSGFQRAKAQTLRALCGWWVDEGDVEALETADLYATTPLLPHLSTAEIRKRLLVLRGIGPETADVLLLYLLGRGVFVADTYARRLFTHLGWDVPPGYHAFARQVQQQMDLPLSGWQEFHALIDEFAKVHARTPEDWAAGPLAGRRLST